MADAARSVCRVSQAPLIVDADYRLWQAGLWLVLLVGVGSLLFGVVYDVNNDGRPPSEDFNPARDPSQVPPFEPVIYSVDVLVPVISLGQRVAWNASGTAQWASFLPPTTAKQGQLRLTGDW